MTEVMKKEEATNKEDCCLPMYKEDDNGKSLTSWSTVPVAKLVPTVHTPALSGGISALDISSNGTTTSLQSQEHHHHFHHYPRSLNNHHHPVSQPPPVDFGTIPEVQASVLLPRTEQEEEITTMTCPNRSSLASPSPNHHVNNNDNDDVEAVESMNGGEGGDDREPANRPRHCKCNQGQQRQQQRIPVGMYILVGGLLVTVIFLVVFIILGRPQQSPSHYDDKPPREHRGPSHPFNSTNGIVTVVSVPSMSNSTTNSTTTLVPQWTNTTTLPPNTTNNNSTA